MAPAAPGQSGGSFHDRFVELFDSQFPRLYRYLDRLSGERELAADLAQEAFVRLYQRGELPDRPEAWLITVATNLFRNARTQRATRSRLLTPARGEAVLADPPPPPSQRVEHEESQQRVREVVDQLPERERQQLLLRAEGYSYREMAIALELQEASVGTLLARAKAAFRARYEAP